MGSTMNKLSRLLLASALLVVVGGAIAYDPRTHGVMSEYAARQSILNDPATGVLESLGMGKDVDDEQFLLPSTFQNPLTSTPITSTPMRLMRFGAGEEDGETRPFNHFFDPQNGGRPLTLLGVVLGATSPDWILEDRFDFGGKQTFSYKDAKNLFYVALTEPNKDTRDRSLGRTFESLGHIVHHLQDMAQPQHVRNDDHCDNLACVLVLRYKRSAYETYTLRRGSQLPLAGYGVADYGTFDVPRKFWENSGKGIAEFTSENFVSIKDEFS